MCHAAKLKLLINYNSMSEIKFKITNITCDACVKLSNMALKTIPGVSEIKIDQNSGEGQLSSSQDISWDQVYAALQSVGKNAIKL